MANTQVKAPMLLNEWIALSGNEPGPEEWEALELVYTWHPKVPRSASAAREYCLKLWKTLGYTIFFDMAMTARELVRLDTSIRELGTKHKEIEDDFEARRKQAEAVYRKAVEDLKRESDHQLGKIQKEIQLLAVRQENIKNRYA